MTTTTPTDEDARRAAFVAQAAQRELSEALHVQNAWTDTHGGQPVPDEFVADTGDLRADVHAKFTAAVQFLIRFRDEHLDVGGHDDPVLREAAGQLDDAFDDIDAALGTLAEDR